MNLERAEMALKVLQNEYMAHGEKQKYGDVLETAKKALIEELSPNKPEDDEMQDIKIENDRLEMELVTLQLWARDTVDKITTAMQICTTAIVQSESGAYNKVEDVIKFTTNQFAAIKKGLKPNG